MEITKIGRKVYYDKKTFEILTITSEISGQGVYSATTDQDFKTYNKLKERVRESVGILQLEYGQYRQDFFECSDIRVNPYTLELEFHYPDMINPAAEPEFQKPLTQQIEELKQSQADLWELLLYGGSSNV